MGDAFTQLPLTAQIAPRFPPDASSTGDLCHPDRGQP